MIWLSVFSLPLGLILLVPTVLQTIDGTRSNKATVDEPASRMATLTGAAAPFLGFAATTFAVSLLIIVQFSVDNLAAGIASLTLGLAAGAVHPEVLSALGRPSSANDGPHAS